MLPSSISISVLTGLTTCARSDFFPMLPRSTRISRGLDDWKMDFVWTKNLHSSVDQNRTRADCGLSLSTRLRVVHVVFMGVKLEYGIFWTTYYNVVKKLKIGWYKIYFIIWVSRTTLRLSANVRCVLEDETTSGGGVIVQFFPLPTVYKLPLKTRWLF